MASINFKGKSSVWNHHLSVPYQILEKDKKLSVKGKNEDENLVIEADNLVALKSLLPKYQGKIKCIYIDPPYNTGNENWVFNDKSNSPLIKDWMGKIVGIDDLTRHDKWLCMMTPRLKLLQELLDDDGIIFISIDDNEGHYLKSLMNEIFEPENYLNTFCWINNLKGRQISGVGAAKTYEYIIAYAKNIKNVDLFKVSVEMLKSLMPSSYKGFNYEAENDDNGAFVVKNELHNTNSVFNEETRPNLVFDIHYNFKTKEVKFSDISQSLSFIGFVKIQPKKNNDGIHFFHAWRWSKKKITNEKEELKFVKTKDGMKIFTKIREYDTANLKDVITNITTTSGVNEFKKLFNGNLYFDYPKPPSLIRLLIDSACGSDKKSIILDSFAGSGTTAQAVLELNKEDNGDRKFILVQLPEKIKKDKPAYKAGFRYVHEITRERVKRVIERDKIDVGFSYVKLGSQIDADSILTGNLPTYKEFAKYVYYLATGKTMDNEKSINEKSYLVGRINGQTVYLIYKKDKEKLKDLAITLEWAEKINKKDGGKKIVYAPACFLDEEYLAKFNIDFVSIPYNLFEKK